MNKLYLFIFLSLLSAHIYADSNNPPKVVGKVTHEKTHQHIPYLTVFVKGTSIGTSTDLGGEFTLKNLPAGKHTIRVQGIGYQPVEKKVSVAQGDVKKIEFEIEEDVFALESAIVSANRNKQDRSETPVIISSITPKLFEQTESVDLTESLKFTPGLRTENSCQNCGVKQIRMNGLEGKYTQILINSKPLFSSLAGVYGLEQIPSSMIERVEIIRGGGSALFGGNAIAGTVNLITKEPLKNSYEAGFHGFSMQGQANDYTLDFSTSIVNEAHSSGIFLFGMNRNRSSFDANNDSFTEIPLMENTSVGFNAFLRPSDQDKFTLDFHRIHEYRRGGNMLEALPHEADIAEEVTHDITGISLSYDRYSKNEKDKFSSYACTQILNRGSYYGANQEPAGYGDTEDMKSTIGVQYHHEADNFLFSPATLTAGLEDTYTTLKDKKLGNDTIDSKMIADQEMNTLGGFVQSEWDLNKFKFLLGIRVDNYQINDQLNNSDIKDIAICPRINAMYDFTKDLQFRISLARGYRAPKIFSEDLHIESSQARKIIHRNASGLKEETSLSLSSSIDYTGKLLDMPVYFLFEGFYTKLKDPFANQIQSDGHVVTYYRINSTSDATVRGINFEGKIQVNSATNVKMGLSLEDNFYGKPQEWGEKTTSKTTDMLRAPSSYGYLITDWDLAQDWCFTLNGNYTGSMLVPHLGVNPGNAYSPDQQAHMEEAINKGYVIHGEQLIESSAFYNLTVSLAYKWEVMKDIELQIKGGVKNILNSYQNNFDQGVFRDAGFIYGPMLPRTFMFSLSFSSLK